MNWIDSQKDFLSLAQQCFTIVAALVGIAAARRWQRELRGRTHHDAAQKAIKEAFNIRSIIAVARRSWRTVLFTHSPSRLRDPATVAEFDRLAEGEKAYWEAHLLQMEAAGVALRNESIIPEAIWGDSYFQATETLKSVIDEWTNAVSARIENLTLFLQTTHPDYLNYHWSPILISDQHYTPQYFEEAVIEELQRKSLDYWNRLDAGCKGVSDVVKKGFIK